MRDLYKLKLPDRFQRRIYKHGSFVVDNHDSYTFVSGRDESAGMIRHVLAIFVETIRQRKRNGRNNVNIRLKFTKAIIRRVSSTTDKMITKMTRFVRTFGLPRIVRKRRGPKIEISTRARALNNVRG